MGKLLRLAAQLDVYGVKAQIMSESSPPSLVMEGGEVVTVSGGFLVGEFGEAFSVRAAVRALLWPEEEPEPVSASAWDVRWGWLSLGVPCYFPGSGGALGHPGWYQPGEAAKIAGVSSAALRRREKATMPTVKTCAEAMLYGFLSANASGRITWIE